MVFRIAITNILEVEIAVEPREPTSGTEHQLGQRGVDVEVILAKDVVRSELPEVHLIEALLKVRNSSAHDEVTDYTHDLVRIVDFVETREERECSQRATDQQICPVRFSSSLKCPALK